jgi:catechol 2,3-dioxygenase-like lactoylglutathione lyase family enzyme
VEPVIDHIQVTVKDLARAILFYDRLMPLLGFEPDKRSRATIPEHDLEVVEYHHPRLVFAISSPRQAFRAEAIHRRRPGSLHHLAFRARSRGEVDELHRRLASIGATIVSSPREYPEYTPAGYYACFFKDPEGIKFELVHHSEVA